jgi:hypothetical protein
MASRSLLNCPWYLDDTWQLLVVVTVKNKDRVIKRMGVPTSLTSCKKGAMSNGVMVPTITWRCPGKDVELSYKDISYKNLGPAIKGSLDSETRSSHKHLVGN